MSIASRIEAINQHLLDDYSILELGGADLTNVDKNIQNLKPQWKNRLEYYLANGLDVVWNNWEKVTGEGTSLSLSPTIEGRIETNLKGNTSQTGTPTPTSSIPVNVVSGDNEIVVCGKNLLNIQGIVKGRLDNGVLGYANNTTDLTLNENSFSFTTNANYRGATSDYIVVQEGDYIFNSNTSNSSYGMNVACYDVNKTWLNNATITAISTDTKRTFTIASGTKYIRIYFYLSSSGTITINNPQLENGSTTSQFEVYNSNTYNIDLPVENLFDKDNANTIECLVNGTNGAIAYFNGTKSLYIPIQSSKTYTISKILSARFVVGTCVSTPANGVTCSVYRANNTGTSITITSGASDKYLCVFYYLSGTDTLTEQQILDSIQIEVGSKANSYTPYGTTPIELCKIGTYQDYFYKDSDKWYLHKEIGKVASYNGETITTSYISTTGGLDTGATVYYVLATPTNTEITDTTLINQLEQFYQAQSKNNQTNISQINNDLPFIISASALKKG